MAVINGMFVPILAFQLKILFPDMIPNEDYIVEVDENGNEHITKWPEGKPLPTQEQLDSVYLQALKKWKELEIKEKAAERLSNLLSDVTEEEVETFWIQVFEAREYQKDPNAPTIFIDTLAATRGIDKNTLIQKILYKAELYSRGAASILGKQQKLLDYLYSDQCSTEEQIINLTFDSEV